MFTIKLFYVAAFCFLAGCSAQKKKKDSMIIIGELNGLPKGVMYLIDSKKTVIDSVTVENGRFLFRVENTNPETLFTLEHNDQKYVKSLFSFPTKRKYNGGPWNSEFFMADDTIRMEGNIKIFQPINFKFPENIQLVYPDKPLQIGKQTWVMYNVDYDFDKPVTDSAYKKLKGLVELYPYSVYLLREINRYRGNYSRDQLNAAILRVN